MTHERLTRETSGGAVLVDRFTCDCGQEAVEVLAADGYDPARDDVRTERVLAELHANDPEPRLLRHGD